jgi:hypothetical protein
VKEQGQKIEAIKLDIAANYVRRPEMERVEAKLDSLRDELRNDLQKILFHCANHGAFQGKGDHHD